MLAMILYILTEVVANNCPYRCECIWRNGKDAALCAFGGFEEMPNGLPQSTQLLDLTENPLTVLKNNVFQDTRLLNLQRLYLISCSISQVQGETFRGLTNLVELDLSKNKLVVVPSESFFYISGLRELKLSGNPITRIKDDDFRNLGDLVRLSLKSCQILQIEPRGFFGLERSLEYLELDHNNLSVIRVNVLAPLRALKDVTLFDNPWNCTCHLRPMRDWMIKKNVPITITPECSYPLRLRSRQWNRIDIDEFVCYPTLIAKTSNIRGFAHEDVILTCEVSVTPAPRIRWYRTGRLLANSSLNSATGRHYVIYSKSSTASNLIIKSAEPQDSGQYTCMTENRAGAAEAIITLTIEQAESYFAKHGLFAWFITVAVILVCSFCIGVFYIEIKKRRRLGESNQEFTVSYQNEQIGTQHFEKRNIEAESAPEVGRKRGDYQNVPSHDPEDMAHSDSLYLSPIPPDTKSTQYDCIHRNYRGNMRIHDFCECDFNQSVHAASFFADKLNVPMRIASETLDSSTKSGTRSRKHNFAYSHMSSNESDNNYPDLIEMSSYETPTRNEVKYEPHYFTMRRRKGGDSCSPLMNNSRRNSSGGDSVNYYERYSKYRQSRRSNSSSDLTITGNHAHQNPSLPGTPSKHCRALSATPLLNVSSLIKYSRPSYSTSEEFENQLVQMESLLNEYRTIGDQLTLSPKQTKDNLQNSRPIVTENIGYIRGNHDASSIALPDAATPLTLNVADLDYKSAPERRSYILP